MFADKLLRYEMFHSRGSVIDELYSTLYIMFVVDKMQEEMTQQEKEKLYAAIGYQESGADAIYPKEVALHLDAVSLS